MRMAQNNQSLSQNSINWMNGYHTWYQSYMQNMMNNGNGHGVNHEEYQNYNLNPPQHY